MSTLHQLVSRNKKFSKRIRPLVPALKKCPQKRGVVQKIFIQTPKKPNSAKRKVAKVKLSTGRVISCYIPGIGHKLTKHSVLLVRGGRAQDLIGVRYKPIFGKFDFVAPVDRISRLSKFGLSNKQRNQVNNMDEDSELSNSDSIIFRKSHKRKPILYPSSFYLHRSFFSKRLYKFDFFRLKKRMFRIFSSIVIHNKHKHTVLRKINYKHTKPKHRVFRRYHSLFSFFINGHRNVRKLYNSLHTKIKFQFKRFIFFLLNKEKSFFFLRYSIPFLNYNKSHFRLFAAYFVDMLQCFKNYQNSFKKLTNPTNVDHVNKKYRHIYNSKSRIYK